MYFVQRRMNPVRRPKGHPLKHVNAFGLPKESSWCTPGQSPEVLRSINQIGPID